MDLLIRSAKIVDPNSPYHHQTRDLFIHNGKIESVGKRLSPSSRPRVFEHKGCHVSPGWMDTFASFCDPGYEYKEDLKSGSLAAAQGGFTAVLLKPDTFPTLHNKGSIEYVIRNTEGNMVDVHPMGALSPSLDSTAISEIYDMHAAGAAAFSNGDEPVDNAGFMLRCLLYVKKFNGVVVNRAYTPSISGNGMVNEGATSIHLGMKGDPAISEELMVQRDISLARYTGSKVHFPKISTAASVGLIRDARRDGVQVSASVTSYHLLIADHMMHEYDSNFKVSPPLRGNEDVRALIRGLNDGTIETVCSDHSPQDIESKNKEFEFASPGMINLESSFGVLMKSLKGKLSLEKIITLLAVNPRKIFGLPVPVIREGENANLTLFDPVAAWTFTEKDIRSKSRNSPFLGKELTGRPLGIVNRNKFYIC